MLLNVLLVSRSYFYGIWRVKRGKHYVRTNKSRNFSQTLSNSTLREFFTFSILKIYISMLLNVLWVTKASTNRCYLTCDSKAIWWSKITEFGEMTASNACFKWNSIVYNSFTHSNRWHSDERPHKAFRHKNHKKQKD